MVLMKCNHDLSVRKLHGMKLPHMVRVLKHNHYTAYKTGVDALPNEFLSYLSFADSDELALLREYLEFFLKMRSKNI